jgi:hypothetical protein
MLIHEDMGGEREVKAPLVIEDVTDFTTHLHEGKFEACLWHIGKNPIDGSITRPYDVITCPKEVFAIELILPDAGIVTINDGDIKWKKHPLRKVTIDQRKTIITIKPEKRRDTFF